MLQALITKYPGENPHFAKAIIANVKKFQNTGIIHNLPHAITKVNKRVELAKKSANRPDSVVAQIIDQESF